MDFGVRVFFIFLLSCFSTTIHGQRAFTIKGVVLDKDSKKPLPFADILSDTGEGTISNEDGSFIIEIKFDAKRLIISYLGYETDTTDISSSNLFYKVTLQSGSIVLSEITVKLFDEKVNSLFYNAIQTSRKALRQYGNSKTFRRTFSTINGETPSEFMEAFYNCEFNNGCIENFELKNGRIGIPVETHVLSLDITKLLEGHHFFEPKQERFPDSPLAVKSPKQLKKKYYTRIINQFTTGEDTIYEVEFEANQSSKYFSGSAFIRKSNNIIEKIKFHTDSVDRIPFKIIGDLEKNHIQKLGMDWEMGIDYVNGNPVIGYLYLVFNLVIGNKAGTLNYHFSSINKLYFFDYIHLFEIPLLSIKSAFESNDYEKIYMLPYNQEFWNRSVILEETKEEQLFRKKLEQEKLFANTGKGEGKSGILKTRFAHWKPHFKVNPTLMTNNTVPRPATGENLGVPFINKVIPTKAFHVETFLFLDYNCYEDTVLFKTEAILDYSNSYYSKSDPISNFGFFRIFMDITQIYALELNQNLSRRYKKKCPPKEELERAIKEAEDNLHSEILTIEANLNSKNRKSYLQNLAKLTMERLQRFYN